MITKTILISTRTVISYTMKQESPSEFDGKLMKTETTTISNGRKAIVEQILASRKKYPNEQHGESHSQRSK